MTGVPAQAPVASQWSPKVQALPSSQLTVAPGKETVHFDVPLHVRTAQGSEGQVMAVPTQAPHAGPEP